MPARCQVLWSIRGVKNERRREDAGSDQIQASSGRYSDGPEKISRSSSLGSVTVFPSRTAKGFAGMIKLRALNGGITLDYKEGSNVIGSCLQEGGTGWVRIRGDVVTEAEVMVMQVREPRRAGSP